MFTAQYKVQRLVLTLGLLALVSLGAPNVLLGNRGNTALAQSAQNPSQDNLNLGFEIKGSKSDLPQGWIIIPNGPGVSPADISGKTEIELDATNVYSGSYSLRVHREMTLLRKFNFGGVRNTFLVDNAAKGKVIRLSGYIKTQDVQRGFAGLWANVVGPGEPVVSHSLVLAYDNMRNQGVHGTTGWTRYQIELPVYANAKKITFGVLMSGSGTAWFDDLSVQVLNEPAINYPPFPQAKRGIFAPSHLWTDFAQRISSTANISQQTLQQQIDLLNLAVRTNQKTLEQQRDLLEEQLADLKQQEAQHSSSELEQRIAVSERQLVSLQQNLYQQEVKLKRQLAKLKQKIADLQQKESQHSSHGLEYSIAVYQAAVNAVENLLGDYAQSQ